MVKSFNEKKLSYLLSHIKLYLHLREKTKGFFLMFGFQEFGQE